MTATVSINGVTHRFSDFLALDDINLTIEAGRFLVLLGPSGCGKTTLLSVLGGFIKPDKGSISLDGVDVTLVPPAKRATTTMFQDYALFPHMTCEENVAFGLRMRGISKSDRQARAQELLTIVGLQVSANKKPHELSGGQRQRVALARALAVEPNVLLLDEPLGALDLKLRRQMQDELKAIQRRVGTTFVHVTHDQEEAMAIADDIVVMNAGRIDDSGSPESIYLKPATRFSAAFMGEANMITGKVDNVTTHNITVLTDQGSVELPRAASTDKPLSKGESVVLSFRPEHILTDTDDSDAVLNLGATLLVDHAFFGTHQRCQLQDDNGRTYTAYLPQQMQLQKGQPIALKVKRSSVVVLPDDETAERPSNSKH